MDIKRLRKIIFLRFPLAFVGFGLIFFVPAGTLRFWEAWAYIAIMFFAVLGVVTYFLKHDPEVLEHRMRMKEKEKVQKKFVLSIYLLFVAGILLVGFDRRWDWSFVPTAAVIAADVLVVLGYAVFFLVIRENRFLSRVVEVMPGQKVVATGPYAVVRHPMYSGTLALYLATPVALGSFWAVIPFAIMAAMFPIRILNEEKVLLRDLDGYKEYTRKTRYRLIPGIW